MSEKGLERETEGISVGEREPVVADSSPKGGRLRSSWKKLWKGRKRKALALLLVVAIAGGVVIWRGRGQTASAATTYQEAAVERRSITNSLSSSGTLEPADSYTVNTLVSGEILSDTFEKGDQVEEGQLLYTIDSSNAASSQTQAQNSYSQAQTSYEQAVEAKYPTGGPERHRQRRSMCNEGDSVSAGTELLKIVADENIYIDFLLHLRGQRLTSTSARPPRSLSTALPGPSPERLPAVSSSSAAVSTGVPLTTVRVRLANPGLVTSDYTASAVIGSYSSYGQASIKVGASSVITAEASGKVSRLQLAGGRYHLQRRPDLHHHRRQRGQRRLKAPASASATPPPAWKTPRRIWRTTPSPRPSPAPWSPRPPRRGTTLRAAPTAPSASSTT